MGVTKQGLMGWRLAPGGENHTWHCQWYQEPVARTFMDTKKKSTSFILLKRCSDKIVSDNLLLSLHIRAHCSALNTGASSCSRWQLTQKATLFNVKRIRDFRRVGHKWDVISLLI